MPTRHETSINTSGHACLSHTHDTIAASCDSVLLFGYDVLQCSDSVWFFVLHHDCSALQWERCRTGNRIDQLVMNLHSPNVVQSVNAAHCGATVDLSRILFLLQLFIMFQTIVFFFLIRLTRTNLAVFKGRPCRICRLFLFTMAYGRFCGASDKLELSAVICGLRTSDVSFVIWKNHGLNLSECYWIIGIMVLYNDDEFNQWRQLKWKRLFNGWWLASITIHLASTLSIACHRCVFIVRRLDDRRSQFNWTIRALFFAQNPMHKHISRHCASQAISAHHFLFN